MNGVIRHDSNFLTQLVGFDLATLEDDTSCIYGLTRELTLSYVNPAWYRFALENGGEALLQDYPVGARITDAFQEPFKSYYTALYHDLLLSGEVGQHDYDCSTGDLCRIFHQTVYPLRNRSGLLVVNSLRITHSLDDGQAVKALADTYLQPTDLITGCVHCKRVLRAGVDDGWWDRIPGWTGKAPANMSHSLCPLCYDYFYKHLDRTV